jgi:signal transduction histidine kinase
MHDRAAGDPVAAAPGDGGERTRAPGQALGQGDTVVGEGQAVVQGAARLAGQLAERSPRILRDCFEELLAAGNVVVLEESSREQMLRNCTQILDDVRTSLVTGDVRVAPGYKLTARDIGISRAAEGIHPGESLQAGSTFHNIVLEHGRELIAGQPNALELFATLARALENSIGQRVREAFAVYTSFLLNTVHEAQVSERHRIARELHDRLGHSVNVAQRQLELFGIYRHTDPDKAAEKVEIAGFAVQEAMASLRAVASGLFSLEPVKSLEKALTNDLGQVDTDGVDLRVRVNGDETWVPPEILDETFLILREAARNALRYARATILLVTVDITPHEVRCLVEDDGCGFDVHVTPESGGVGLSAMRERVGLLGGRLSIRSEAGYGTQVGFTVRL